MKKAEIQAMWFTECWDYINSHAQEDVWMTFTDFDEVLYCQRQESMKYVLDWANYFGYSYFDGAIVQLFPPKNLENCSLLPFFRRDNRLVHTIDGIRCGLWTFNEPFKTTLLHVNCFSEINTTKGHHQTTLKQIIKGKNFEEQHALHVFHLKYIDGTVIKNKVYNNSYSGISDFDDTYYNSMLGSSFPIDMYFAYKCMTYQKMPNVGTIMY